MKNVINKIMNNENITEIFEFVLKNLFEKGPADTTDMEILCYLYIYQTDKFKVYENSILKYMGLNYKDVSSETLPEIIFGIYSKCIEDTYSCKYTPVQVRIVEGIKNNKCYSFSAPTSTGKSFVFRNIIMNSKRDIVIIVPSRALINEYYNLLCRDIENKKINILTFIDKINTKNAIRNIFIVTPERCKDLFKLKDEFDIEFFLLDEAQLGNEDSFRGLFYDSIIRRSQKAYPNAKFVFAHPFIKNPEIQIKKNHFDESMSLSDCYIFKNVGQMFYAYDNNVFYHFGIDKEVMGKNKLPCEFDPIERILFKSGSVLVYTTKSSIYNKKVFAQFKKYIDMCPEIEDDNAHNYIKQIKRYIGANENVGEERYSQMLNMLKHGIVIHHGSLPLQARILLEEFTQLGFCRICFATSTLEQGINMPFDVVFLNTFETSKSLSVKNLIGRAGRSSNQKKFDYGSVIVKVSNISSLRKIMNTEDTLEEISLLEKDVDIDLREFKDAINNGTLSDEYNITQNQLEKFKNRNSHEIVNKILNMMFDNENNINSKINKDLEYKKKINYCFQEIYEIYLGRTLEDGERNVFSTALQIMFWQFECHSFREICFYRYAYASKKQKRDEIRRQYSKNDEFANIILRKKLDKLYAEFVTGYSDIPNKKLKVYSIFGNNQTKTMDVDYDRIVFDTYDYLDKIINFRLSDIFIAAFEEYYCSTNDERARKLVLLVKYGTTRQKEIWMLRYGFTFEDIEWLDEYILSINQEEIIFKENVNKLPKDKRQRIERYMNVN